ncbi:MAG: Mini-ribonuclease 3 [Clostridia bacterium]|nr:Mini-ribonuclease 3 [Clostridia bacterium]
MTAFSLSAKLTVAEAKQFNPVVLAFLGDAVYSLYVREKLCFSTDYKTGELQKLTSLQVSAHGQSELLERLRPLFTAEEEEIFLRGRNAKKGTRSKSASVAEYNRSTGFEAVIGFLYITGQTERIDELLRESEERI